MEYAKDKIFDIHYNEKKNTLVLGKERTSFFSRIFKTHKLIKIIIMLTVILSIANILCIYNFSSILSKI